MPVSKQVLKGEQIFILIFLHKELFWHRGKKQLGSEQFAAGLAWLILLNACHDYNFPLQVKDEKPPAPTLGLSPKGADDEEGGEDGEDGGGGGEDAAAPTVNLVDLVPRNDIR